MGVDDEGPDDTVAWCDEAPGVDAAGSMRAAQGRGISAWAAFSPLPEYAYSLVK